MDNTQHVSNYYTGTTNFRNQPVQPHAQVQVQVQTFATRAPDIQELAEISRENSIQEEDNIFEDVLIVTWQDIIIEGKMLIRPMSKDPDTIKGTILEITNQIDTVGAFDTLKNWGFAIGEAVKESSPSATGLASLAASGAVRLAKFAAQRKYGLFLDKLPDKQKQTMWETKELLKEVFPLGKGVIVYKALGREFFTNALILKNKYKNNANQKIFKDWYNQNVIRFVELLWRQNYLERLTIFLSTKDAPHGRTEEELKNHTILIHSKMLIIQDIIDEIYQYTAVTIETIKVSLTDAISLHTFRGEFEDNGIPSKQMKDSILNIHDAQATQEIMRKFYKFLKDLWKSKEKEKDHVIYMIHKISTLTGYGLNVSEKTKNDMQLIKSSTENFVNLEQDEQKELMENQEKNPIFFAKEDDSDLL